MANTRSRKTAPTRTPGTPPAKASDAAKSTVSAKVSTATTSTAAATKSTAAAAKDSKDGSGKRFGDGGSVDATKPARTSTAGAKSSAKSGARPASGSRGGRGGRGGRPAPPVKVANPKPWGMIAATVAVLVFAAGAIGYAVYQANSSAPPDSAEDIDGVTVAEYASGQEHVTTDVDYAETPSVGGPHDLYWADCDGAVYDQQVRSENAVHSMEHGAVWITYNPDDISGDDLETLIGYAENQPYTLLSPFAGLSSPISLQSWNHQLFVDDVADPRITQFIQVLRQNPEEYPEVGASCSQPTFLEDPVIEGEQSRVPETANTDAPTAP